MSLFEQIQIVTERIQNCLDSSNRKDAVILVAATKTQNIEKIESCIKNGIIQIGENRVQEADKKFTELRTKNIKCVKRMIGHLQSNKINKALNVFDTIDSIDKVSLAKKIAVKTTERKKSIQTLLEVNTSREKNKFGFKPEDDQGMIECIELKNLNVVGLMTLGPNTTNKKETQRAFASLRKTRETLNRQISKKKKLTDLSMGMSRDYEVGIEQGSTIVRLGTALFGRRDAL